MLTEEQKAIINLFLPDSNPQTLAARLGLTKSFVDAYLKQVSRG